MHLARTRTLLSLALIASVLALGGALYLEFAVGLVPCPLCRLQQWCMGICTVVCAIALVRTPASRNGGLYYSIGLLLASLLGAYASARQVWLQSAPPDDLVGCLVALQEKVDSQSVLGVMIDALFGDADCAEINWSLFGITLPEWSLLAFVGLLVLAAGQLIAGSRRLIKQRKAASDETPV